VVYGPASTIYGANAFTGVISVTTRQPKAFLEDGENLGFVVQAAGGSFQTSYLDATVAGRTPSGRLSWSLTGRSFRSDERDLSGFEDWDYDFSALDELDYRETLRIEGALAVSLVAGDGIPVATAKRDDGFDPEALAAELLTQVRAISDEQRDLAVGEVDQYSVSTDRYTILIGLMQAGYYLLLVQGRDSSFGRARFEMRRARLLFEDDLG